jgi:hypothetical protein
MRRDSISRLALATLKYPNSEVARPTAATDQGNHVL